MHEQIQWRGYTLAAPILRHGAELSHLIEDYFPNKDPELWFSWDQAKQNKWVRDNFDGCGVVFGPPRPDEVVETHHLVPLGAGHKDMNNWPGVMIPVLRSFDGSRSTHTLLEAPSNMGMRVAHWDPLDTEGGLEVVDGEGRALDHKDLWFYHRPSHDKVLEAREWERLMLEANKRFVEAEYALGPLAMVADEHVKLLGAKSLADWCGQHGVSVAPLRKMMRLFDSMYEHYQDAAAALVPPSVFDMVRRVVPEDDRIEVVRDMLTYCSPLSEQPSMSDFITNVKEDYPRNVKPVKVSVVPPGVPVEKMEKEDINAVRDELPPEMQGGTIIKGWPVD